MIKFKNVYFINGTAYAGKSTMIKLLSKKFNGILCEENYHNRYIEKLDEKKFPSLTYTQKLVNWQDFVRRTPIEYCKWIDGCNKECEILELKILEELSKSDRLIFVDTNIGVDKLKEISDYKHVLIMLAPQEISINRFFERNDKEKQFIYQLLQNENDSSKALENYKECLKLCNSEEKYEEFLKSGFKVIFRDDNRSIEDTFKIVCEFFELKNDEK